MSGFGAKIEPPSYYDILTGKIRKGSAKGWLLAASMAAGNLQYGAHVDPSYQNVLDMNAWSRQYGSMQPSPIDYALGLQGPPGREIAVSGLIFNAFSGKTGQLVSAASKLAHMGYNRAVEFLSNTEKEEFDRTLSSVGSVFEEYPSRADRLDPRAADPRQYGPWNETTQRFLDSLDEAELKRSIREGREQGVISPLVPESSTYHALKRFALSYDARIGNVVDYLRGVPSEEAWNYIKSGSMVSPVGDISSLVAGQPVVMSNRPEDIPGDKPSTSLFVYGDPEYPIDELYSSVQRNGSPRKMGTVRGFPEPYENEEGDSMAYYQRGWNARRGKWITVRPGTPGSFPSKINPGQWIVRRRY